MTLPLPVSGTFTGTVVSVGVDVMNTTIAAGSVVLAATGMYEDALAALDPNETVAVNLVIEDPWQDVVNAVGGLRILVHEGVPAATATTQSWCATLGLLPGSPRKAESSSLPSMAVRRRFRWLAQAELAQLMASLGSIEAINLDGGGSTDDGRRPRRFGAVGHSE